MSLQVLCVYGRVCVCAYLQIAYFVCLFVSLCIVCVCVSFHLFRVHARHKSNNVSDDKREDTASWSDVNTV